jgi:hypothetical protein
MKTASELSGWRHFGLDSWQFQFGCLQREFHMLGVDVPTAFPERPYLDIDSPRGVP